MSGYPDDRTDSPRPPNPRDVTSARSAVQFPAVLLIVTGILSLIGNVWGLVQLPDLPAQMDDSIAQIDADPNIPREQKDMWKQVFTSVKQWADHPAVLVGYIFGIAASLVVAIGGVKMMSLSGRGFPIAGSILAMIPCTVGCCCILGLPAGIWSLVVLNRPDVKAAFAASRSASPHDPDAQYMR